MLPAAGIFRTLAPEKQSLPAIISGLPDPASPERRGQGPAAGDQGSEMVLSVSWENPPGKGSTNDFLDSDGYSDDNDLCTSASHPFLGWAGDRGAVSIGCPIGLWLR